MINKSMLIIGALIWASEYKFPFDWDFGLINLVIEEEGQIALYISWTSDGSTIITAS